jgi:hypothetical protein
VREHASWPERGRTPQGFAQKSGGDQTLATFHEGLSLRFTVWALSCKEWRLFDLDQILIWALNPEERVEIVSLKM